MYHWRLAGYGEIAIVQGPSTLAGAVRPMELSEPPHRLRLERRKSTQPSATEAREKDMNGTSQPMQATKRGVFAALALTLLLLLAACSGNDKDQNALASLLGHQVEVIARGGATGSGLGAAAGIHATGVGIVESRPDIAVMSIGVETFAATVSIARGEAAVAMAAMIAVLRAAGIDDADLQTQFFSVQPEYTYDQVVTTLENGQKVTRSERRLVGYRIRNTLSVTIRDLDNIGTIVDSAAGAGGDATRLNNISFTVDDGSALEAQARVLALRDAVAKADLYASVTGVDRGKLVSIVETSGTQYPKTVRAEAFATSAMDGAAPPTQILAGDLQVRVSVQTVFSID